MLNTSPLRILNMLGMRVTQPHYMLYFILLGFTSLYCILYDHIITIRRLILTMFLHPHCVLHDRITYASLDTY